MSQTFRLTLFKKNDTILAMSIEPSPEQLSFLRPVERFNFRVIHALNRSPGGRRLLTVLGASLGKTWVELGTSKTVHHHGFDNFQKIDPERAVLLAANHRTFYDHFVISARLFRLYGPHHNIYFPVRGNFFYDNILGLFVNLIVALFVMYPPIIRDKKRRSWNAFATDLMADLLTRPENLIGYHPEGTRNRGPDPYEFLPAKPGCGELIYRSNPNVVPVFLQGFPRNFTTLLGRNLKRGPVEPIVHMVMGEPLDFSAERQLPPGIKTNLMISQKVMQAIAGLAKKEREIRRLRRIENEKHKI